MSLLVDRGRLFNSIVLFFRLTFVKERYIESSVIWLACFSPTMVLGIDFLAHAGSSASGDRGEVVAGLLLFVCDLEALKLVRLTGKCGRD